MSERRYYSPETRENLTRMVLDEGRGATEVAREWGVPALTVSTWASRERARRRGTAQLNGAIEELPKDAQLISFQGGVIKELRRKLDLLEGAFDGIRAVLVETENALDVPSEE